jgi:hypothetical protein
MDLLAVALIAQTDPTVVQLDRIADLLRILAWAMAGLAAMGVAIGAYTLYLLINLIRVIVGSERAARDFLKRNASTIETARRVVEESADSVRLLHGRVEDVSSTVDSLNDALRQAGRGAEARVREFVAVLDVVREEAQELLIDTAATAHGVHTAAAALREPRPKGRALRPEPPPPIPDEVRRTSHGQG